MSGESPERRGVFNVLHRLAPHEAVHLVRRKGNEVVLEVFGTRVSS